MLLKLYFLGIYLEVQFVPIPRPVRTIPGRISKAKYELLFEASDIPPFGFMSYYVLNQKGIPVHDEFIPDFKVCVNILCYANCCS